MIFGHYQLRKLTGESPQYLVHMMPLHPIRTFKFVLWFAAKYDPVTSATFLLTEFMVNVAAMFDFARRRDHGQWGTASSQENGDSPSLDSPRICACAL